MYAEYYQLLNDPFALSPDGKLCYVHKSYSKARSYLEYALYRKDGIVLITGDPGTGKTSLVKELTRVLDKSKTRIITLSTLSSSADALIMRFAAKLGCEMPIQSIGLALQEIEHRLLQIQNAGGRAILILDEAQALSIEALEQARLFSNFMNGDLPLVQIVLVGQDELRKKILGPELVQLHQRIIAAAKMENLKGDDVQKYFLHAVGMAGWKGTPSFDPEIFPAISSASQGNPRWINQIGSRLMLHGMLEEKSALTRSDVMHVVEDLVGESLLPNSFRRE